MGVLSKVAVFFYYYYFACTICVVLGLGARAAQLPGVLEEDVILDNTQRSSKGSAMLVRRTSTAMDASCPSFATSCVTHNMDMTV